MIFFFSSTGRGIALKKFFHGLENSVLFVPHINLSVNLVWYSTCSKAPVIGLSFVECVRIPTIAGSVISREI